jgi:ABC-2 type transport system permease protein
VRKESRGYFETPIGVSLLASSAAMFALAIYSADRQGIRARLSAPLFLLSGFAPAPALAEHRVALIIGFARVMMMVLIPMIGMRLFVEEKRARTIEMLFTSPLRDRDLVWGKWLGALMLFFLILACSIVEMAMAWRWSDPDWAVVPAAYLALFALGAGLLAIGEYVSSLVRHESTAAMITWVASLILFRSFGAGVIGQMGLMVCGVLTIAGWTLTWRSIQTMRGRI